MNRSKGPSSDGSDKFQLRRTRDVARALPIFAVIAWLFPLFVAAQSVNDNLRNSSMFIYFFFSLLILIIAAFIVAARLKSTVKDPMAPAAQLKSEPEE